MTFQRGTACKSPQLGDHLRHPNRPAVMPKTSLASSERRQNTQQSACCWLAASPREGGSEGGPSALGVGGTLSGSPAPPLEELGDQAQGGSEGPGQLPLKSPPPSLRKSPENPRSVQEEADNLSSCPSQPSWRTRRKGHSGSLG